MNWGQLKQRTRKANKLQAAIAEIKVVGDEREREYQAQKALEEAEAAVLETCQFYDEVMAGIGIFIVVAFEAGYWAGKS